MLLSIPVGEIKVFALVLIQTSHRWVYTRKVFAILPLFLTVSLSKHFMCFVH